MKIVYISTSIIPSKYANSVHVMKMCEALANMGNEVTLIGRKSDKSVKECYVQYGVEENFKIKNIPQLRIPLIGALLYAKIAIKEAQKQDFELVYTRNLYAAYYSTRIKKQTVFECHKLFNKKIKDIICKKIINSKYLKAFIIISNRLKKEFIKQYLNTPISDRIYVAHDGVDIERYVNLPKKEEARKNMGLPKDKKIVSYTGQLYKGKGAEIIPKIALQMPEVIFNIVGGKKDDIEKMNTQIEKTGVTNVMMTGFVPHYKVKQYMAASDLLLMPYQKRVTVEGKEDISFGMSPLKMFEYMASEVPIVSSDLVVLKEVLKQKHNAILVDPENIKEWVYAIQELLENKELYEKLSRNQKRDVLQYSWEKRAKKIMMFVQRKVG